jgi:hypothetical protein
MLVIASALLLCSLVRTAGETWLKVSYGRQIAPIFALHCYGCHGDSNPSSGFQISTYKGLRAGGVLGDDIVPGYPDRSMLVKFIEGFRGPEQRMPQGSRPLTGQQISLIRRWISEGALDDQAVTPCYKLVLPGCPIDPKHPLRVSSRISAAADLIIRLKDTNGHTLFREESSIKPGPERMDKGAPGDLLHWILNYETTWPKQVTLEFTIRYVPSLPHAELTVDAAGTVPRAMKTLRTSSCPPD